MSTNEDVQRALEISAAAFEGDNTADFEKEISESRGIRKAALPKSVDKWIRNVPRNLGIGSFRAALNIVESADDVFEAGSELVMGPLIAGVKAAGEKTASPEKSLDPVPSLRKVFPGVFEAAHNFADEAEVLNTFADDITQGFAQFVIPFTGYLKALGGIKNVSKLAGTGRLILADGMTSATAFEAHEGRISEVFEMGRQMENEFGAFLNKISPDGSLANAYIDMMVNTENESALKGRYKNAVDGMVFAGASLATLKVMAKVTGTTLKAARKLVVTPGRLEIPANAKFATKTEPEVLEPAKRKVSSSLDEVSGEQTVTIPDVGEAVAQRGDGILQMKRIDVVESERGTGAGMEILIQMIDEAETQGLKFVSDVTVSPSAARLYEGLTRRGFNVKRNPAKVNPNTGSLLSEDPRVPVFEVLPTKKPGVALTAAAAGTVALLEATKRK